MPLRLISTPLEVFQGSKEYDTATSHNIPTNYPSISSSSQSAISAECYTTNALAIISTPFTDQCILELRTFNVSSSQRNRAAHQFLFPAPILDTAFLSASQNNSLTLQICTSSGVVYRILLPLDLLDSIDEVPSRWISEYRVSSLGSDPQDVFEHGLLTSFHTSQDGILSLAACKDGRVIKVLWEEDDHSVESLSGEYEDPDKL